MRRNLCQQPLLGNCRAQKSGAPSGTPQINHWTLRASLRSPAITATAATTVAAATAAAATAAAATATAATSTAVATAAATATTAATTAATEGRTFFTWACFVDSQGAALELLAVERLDGGFHAFFVRHRDEGESTWATGFAIHDEAYFGDCSVLAEKFVEIALSAGEGEIPHIHLGVHSAFADRPAAASSTVPEDRVSNHH